MTDFLNLFILKGFKLKNFCFFKRLSDIKNYYKQYCNYSKSQILVDSEQLYVELGL